MAAKMLKMASLLNQVTLIDDCGVEIYVYGYGHPLKISILMIRLLDIGLQYDQPFDNNSCYADRKSHLINNRPTLTWLSQPSTPLLTSAKECARQATGHTGALFLICMFCWTSSATLD